MATYGDMQCWNVEWGHVYRGFHPRPFCPLRNHRKLMWDWWEVHLLFMTISPLSPICPTPHLRESCIYECTSLSLSLSFNIENPLQLKIESFDIKISFKDVHLVWWVVIEMVSNKVIGKAYVWIDEKFACTCNKHKDMCIVYLSSIHVKSFPM